MKRLLNKIFRCIFSTFIFFLITGLAQLYGQINVSGRVIDSETNDPLIGVNVIIQGTTMGTITDVNGNFSLTVPGRDAILFFSYVGYEEQGQIIGNRTIIEVEMNSAIEALDEVVVIGYGTQKKIDLSGSVAVVEANDLETLPIISAGEALKGRASGVYVKSNSGQPGSSPSILIRGRSSISAGNSPLIVVDGVPGVDMSDVDINDIVSFSVLKDAASAAIYGSTGANGVILITTKRGQAGKNNITFGYSTSWLFPPKKLDVLNSEQALDMINDINTRGEVTPFLGDRYISGYMIDTNNLVHIDWQDEIFRVARMNNYNLAFSGGNQNFSYNVSGTYLNQEGYVLPSEYERFTFRSNLDYKLSDKLKMVTDFSLVRTNRRTVQEGDYAWNGNNILIALNTYPLIPIYNENGGYFINPFQPNIDVPTADINGSYGKGYNTSMTGKYGLTYEIFKGLKYQFDLMGQVGLSKSASFQSRYHTDVGRQASGNASSSTSEGFRWDMNHILNYQKTLGDHNLEVMAGFVVLSTSSYSQNSSRRGFPSDTIPHVYIETNTYPDLSVSYGAGSGRSDYRKFSYIGRIDYNYKSKYYFKFNLRNDGSSRFGPENRWGTFPSASLAWRISEERFMSSIATITDLKLRFSYGITGNDAFSNYLFMSFYSAGSNHGMWNNDEQAVGFAPGGSAPNPNLKWEESVEQNLGIDLSLLSNRVTFTFDIYNKNSYDLLYNANMPVHTGYSSGYINIGKVNVQGYDIQLITHNISTSNFNWITTFTFSSDRNKVVDLGTLGDQFRGDNIVREGEPIDAHYGYIMDGVFSEQAEVNVLNTTLPDGTPVYYQSPLTTGGDIKFRNTNGFETDSTGNPILDINGNPYERVTTDDRTIIGKPNPDFYFGFDNRFTYKKWELSFFFQGIYGNDVFSLTRREIERMDHYFNYSALTLDRWKTPGQVTNVPRAIVGDPNDNNRTSTRWFEDGSFIRLKYLTIGYRLPGNILSKLMISSAQVYLTAENILTFTDYSLYDPEVATNGSSGIDMGGVPQSRNFLIGIRIGF